MTCTSNWYLSGQSCLSMSILQQDRTARLSHHLLIAISTPAQAFTEAIRGSGAAILCLESHTTFKNVRSSACDKIPSPPEDCIL